MTYTNELYHHGVKGMRWGVRRYQNEDGSLTAAGKRKAERESKRAQKLETYKAKTKKRLDKPYDKKISRLERKLSRTPGGSPRVRKIRRQLKQTMREQERMHKQVDRMKYGDMRRNQVFNALNTGAAAYNTIRLAAYIAPPLIAAGALAVAKAQANSKILDVPYEVIYDDSWAKQVPAIRR